MDDELIQLMKQINSINKTIMYLWQDLSVPSLKNDLLKQMMVNEVVSTNRIEGITCSHQEILKMLEMEKSMQSFKFSGLLNGYKKMIDQEPFEVLADAKDIRALYDSILIQDICLEDLPDGLLFRKEAVEIHSGGKAYHKGSAPESKIIKNLNIALNFLNDEHYPFLIRISAFHYLFGSIHPFYDGNGRMARYISSDGLRKAYPAYVSLQLSSSIYKHLSAYYKAFNITNDPRNKGDITYFVIVFLEILYNGLKYLESSLVA